MRVEEKGCAGTEDLPQRSVLHRAAASEHPAESKALQLLQSLHPRRVLLWSCCYPVPARHTGTRPLPSTHVRVTSVTFTREANASSPAGACWRGQQGSTRASSTASFCAAARSVSPREEVLLSTRRAQLLQKQSEVYRNLTWFY